MALVYSNFNASKAAISIGIVGNYTWDEKVYSFTPVSSGFCNRKFDDVTPNDNIYYYFFETYFNSGVTDHTKAILIKMDSTDHIRLQFVDNNAIPLPGDPTVNWSLPASVVYYR